MATTHAATASNKITIHGRDGKSHGTTDLPAVFATPLRPDLIRKAVNASQANRRQRYGAMPVAGERPSVEWAGKGVGRSRVPRMKQASDAAFAPNVVGGRRAHPPESRHYWTEKVNRKERRLAIASAIAATGQAELVKGRGHKFDEKLNFPVVVADDFVTGKVTAELLERLEKLGVGADLVRAKEGIHVRAGIGKLRGRRYRTPRSVLIITADGKAPGAHNLAGVEVVSARRVSAEHLAPGGDFGRLTVYTQAALAEIKEAFA